MKQLEALASPMMMRVCYLQHKYKHYAWCSPFYHLQ